MAEIISFKYTKADGKTSHRVALVISSPSDKYFAIDISDIALEKQDDFAEEYNALKETQKAELAKLMDKYDLKHNFRFFIQDRMTDVEIG